MHVAIITAGGAGMFCGSCMHDNTFARALSAGGADVTLIPTYTPIRVDEENLSTPEVFLGGINLYLDYRLPLWRKIPRSLTRWLDAPSVLNLTRFASSDPKKLGPLTLAMLEGDEGPQRREIDELVEFLAGKLRPDVVCFSNALLVGIVRRLKQRFDGPVYCLLQGDDIFLEDLPGPYRSRAIEMIRERIVEFDGFLVNSRYYRDFMAEYLGVPVEKCRLVPLGIDLTGHDGEPAPRNNGAFTIGYFARVCPEKGLQRLVEAFRILHREFPGTRLRAGGFLQKRDRAWFHRLKKSARDLGNAFEYIGSPARLSEKVAFLKSLDVLSVPTVYHECKGLYVLEALANGVPVVQPRHGAFPELIEATQGGLLVNPDDPEDLARALKDLMQDAERRAELAVAGHAAVRAQFDPTTMAEAALAIFNGADAFGSESTAGQIASLPGTRHVADLHHGR